MPYTILKKNIPFLWFCHTKMKLIYLFCCIICPHQKIKSDCMSTFCRAIFPSIGNFPTSFSYMTYSPILSLTIESSSQFSVMHTCGSLYFSFACYFGEIHVRAINFQEILTCPLLAFKLRLVTVIC